MQNNLMAAAMSWNCQFYQTFRQQVLVNRGVIEGMAESRIRARYFSSTTRVGRSVFGRTAVQAGAKLLAEIDGRKCALFNSGRLTVTSPRKVCNFCDPQTLLHRMWFSPSPPRTGPTCEGHDG